MTFTTPHYESLQDDCFGNLKDYTAHERAIYFTHDDDYWLLTSGIR